MGGSKTFEKKGRKICKEWFVDTLKTRFVNVPDFQFDHTKFLNFNSLMAVLRDYHLNLVALFLPGHPETPIWDRVVTCHTFQASALRLSGGYWCRVSSVWISIRIVLVTSNLQLFLLSWCYCHIFPTVLDQIPDQGASTGMAFTNRRIIPVPGFFDAWKFKFGKPISVG